jgi:signal transduction histidine kinase
VRDHGPGFDLAEVPQDRFGVRESILGRMARHGGSAALRRLDDGTEVSLSLPLTAADAHPQAQPEAHPQLQPEAQPDSQSDTEGTR